MIATLLLMLPLLTASALDLEKLLKTIKESSSGFSHKYNRTYLNISGLGIEKLGSGLFEQFGELTHLDLSFNDIRYVDNLAFYGLRNLSILNLSHNSGLYTLSHDSMLPLEKIEEMVLDATHISSLPANVFKHNKKLRKVSLNTPFLICDCDLQKLAQRFDFDQESRCLYPIKLRGSPVRSLKDTESVCKASADLQMRVIRSKRERSTGGSYWSVDCSVNNIRGHVIEIKLDGRPLHNLDGLFTVTERRYHDRHHIILNIIENFVPHHPWICYAEVDGAPDAKAFYIPASCPEETIRNGSREVDFPRTPPDTILEIRCINRSTLLSRECSMSGVWGAVDISICPETADSCDVAVDSVNVDAFLRNASNCPRGLVLSKIDSLQGNTASDLVTLCSLTSVDAEKRSQEGIGRDKRGRWRCGLDSAVVITRKSQDRERISRYRIARLEISTFNSFLPNALSSEVFGVAMSDVSTAEEGFAEDTIVLNFSVLDHFGTATPYRLTKDGSWRKISPSFCTTSDGFGPSVQVSCSSFLLSSDFSLALFGVAASCDVQRLKASTTKLLVALSCLLFLLAVASVKNCDPESIVSNLSVAVFSVAIMLRTFSSLGTEMGNQLIHAGLIHHLLMRCLSGRCTNCLLAISVASFAFFLALSLPPITDHCTHARVYVTPAPRFAGALFSPTRDTLLLAGPIIILTILSQFEPENRGSRLWLILSPFIWLLTLLLRIGETCDSLKSSLLDALLLIISVSHTVLSLRSNTRRSEVRKSYSFHHHISFTEEETSLY